jgi:hypothetical protein
MPGGTNVLGIPVKSEWPIGPTAKQLRKDRAGAWRAFTEKLHATFAAIDICIGNDSYGAEWGLVIDDAARKNHESFVAPTSNIRRLVHRALQILLTRILTDAFAEHYPGTTCNYNTEMYHNDSPHGDDGEPYCMGTALYAALDKVCMPNGAQAKATAQAAFARHLKAFPGLPDSSDMHILEQWIQLAIKKYNTDIAPNVELAATSSLLLNQMIKTLNARSMSDVPDLIVWKDFTQSRKLNG